MNSIDERFEALARELSNREKKIRRRSIVYSAAPVILGIGLVIVTYFSLRAVNTKLEAKRLEVTSLEARVETFKNQVSGLTLQVDSLTEKLWQATNFVDRTYEFRWETIKFIASEFQPQAMALEHIMSLQREGVRWRLRGFSPEEGFDSPSFAAFIISNHSHHHIDPGDRYRLREILPPTDAPHAGDLIFYDMGYTMFYFRDEHGKEFCVGMTPVGIITLDINFGPRILGYARIDYR